MILNNRLRGWLKRESKLRESQTGFKEKRRSKERSYIIVLNALT